MTPIGGLQLKVHTEGCAKQRQSTFEPCGGIYGTVSLGLVQEKWRDFHWESHLVQNMDLGEALMVICQVENLRVQNWESILVNNLELS